MKQNLDIGLKGHFTLVVSGPRGVRVHEAPNLILNAGRDRMLAATTERCTDWVQIGTGNAAVTAGDATLQNRIQSSSTIQSAYSYNYVAGPPDYVEATTTFRFAVGALNSAVSGNFQEVGIGWASTGSLFSRALISPSIQVLADEQLDVIYRLRVYPIQADVTGNITLDSVSYAYVIRPAGLSSTSTLWAVGEFVYPAGAGLGLGGSAAGNFTIGATFAYSGGLAARTGQPTGAIGSFTSTRAVGPVGAYVGGSYQRTRRVTYDLNEHNGNIKTITFAANARSDTSGSVYGATHQIEFTPVIPKTAARRLTLDFTYTFANRP